MEYPVEENLDVPEAAADSLDFILEEPGAEEKLPVTADELFDDFVFEFARLKNVQIERVAFPLPVVMHGKDTVWFKRSIGNMSPSSCGRIIIPYSSTTKVRWRWKSAPT